MARKVILDKYYTFTPATRTVVLPRAIPKERLVLITDVTTNQVIYNFSDPNLQATSYTIAASADNTTYSTTIVLNYNTSALAATDNLQIIIDEYDEKFTPSETYLDPINKLRTSTPQSLIDTDYEYSIQTTKWEQLALTNNQPFAYYVTATGNQNLTALTATNGSRSYTANVGTNQTPPAIGSPIVVLDSLYAGADGIYIVDANNNTSNTNALGTANTFSYTGKFYYTNPTGSIFNSGVTTAYQGYTFSNTSLSIATANAVGNVITVTTNNPHGLALGNEVALTGANTANGSWVVSSLISNNTFQFNTTGVLTPGQGLVTTTNANLYMRPQGLAVHRAFDGGVRFSTNASSHNQQYVRQTRRYLRYQSGKGIQMSTGTTLKAQLNLDGITASGTLLTVSTKDPHNINYPTQVTIAGATDPNYNGTFTVQNVINPYQFTLNANSAPSISPAYGPIYGSVSGWTGASNRVGIFDSQNGLFWEFDGSTLYAVRRSSVYQISGTVNVVPNSTQVTTGTNSTTYFTKQLNVNDFVVIKGMSYRVTSILSDSQLTIQPAYRGSATQTNAVLSRTVDYRVPTSSFNIDRLDGTGPSGYVIDLTKMQMFYIDYSWYGAGFIRFGVRGPDGNVIYCHRIVNNNVNFLAYMRSGNLPARYETNTFSKTTYMTGGASGFGTNFLSTDTSLTANTNSLVGWPTSGILLVKGPTSNVEYIGYTGITSNTTFTGLTRGQAGANTTGNLTTGNNYITSLATTTGVQVGQYIYGLGIPNQSYVTSIPNSTTVVMTQAAIGTGTGNTIVFMPMANTAQTFNYSATAQTSIELHSPQFAPEINHWGTSAIMDGGFTNDKSFIFTKGMTNTINVAPTASQAVMSFRIAPSASNGVGASSLGLREVINRLQHLPFEADVYSNGSFLMTVLLNATTSNTAEQWTNVAGSSLSQYVFHNQGTTATGGEAVFGFYLNTNQGTYATTQQDLSQLLAIGHSILGGGSANLASGIYPNGPDVLTFVATNIDTATRAIQARYSWNEAQA